MTFEQVKQQLLMEGKNPDDYAILVTSNGYFVWRKDVAPNFMLAAEQISERGDLRVLAEVYYEIMKLGG